MKKYIPNPVDTKSVDLPKGLEPLVEEMSKNGKQSSKNRILYI